MENFNLNKKGMSIIELIVSLLLVSIVLVFLFNLLSDATNEYKSGFFAKDNQINRIEIISTFQNAIKNIDVVTCVECGGGNLKVETGENNYSLNYSSNEIFIKKNSSIIKKWKLSKGITVSTKGFICQSVPYIGSLEIYNCSLEIYTNDINNKEGNNNAIDDITVTFIEGLPPE